MINFLWANASVLQGLGHFVTRFWGALLSVFPDILQMNTWQIRALDHFIPDHTLCVKLVFRTSIVAAVGSEQDCKRSAAGKTASGWQRARVQADGSRQDCKLAATGKDEGGRQRIRMADSDGKRQHVGMQADCSTQGCKGEGSGKEFRRPAAARKNAGRLQLVRKLADSNRQKCTRTAASKNAGRRQRAWIQAGKESSSCHECRQASGRQECRMAGCRQECRKARGRQECRQMTGKNTPGEQRGIFLNQGSYVLF